MIEPSGRETTRPANSVDRWGCPRLHGTLRPSPGERADRGLHGTLLNGTSFLLFCCLSLALGSCDRLRGAAARPIDRVPSGCLMAAEIDWNVVQSDPGLTRVLRTLGIEDLLTELGISPSDVTAMTVFVKARNARLADPGIIVAGSFHAREIVSDLESQGWEPSPYGDVDILMGPDKSRCVAHLRSNLLVIGTLTATQSVIEVEADPGTGLAAEQRYARLLEHSGLENPALTALIRVPQGLQDSESLALGVASDLLKTTGWGVMGRLLEHAGLPQALAYSLAPGDGGYPAELVVLMKDEQAAGMAAGALGAIQRLGAIVPSPDGSDSDQEMKESLRSLSVEQEGELLLIRLILAPGDLVPRD